MEKPVSSTCDDKAPATDCELPGREVEEDEAEVEEELSPLADDKFFFFSEAELSTAVRLMPCASQYCTTCPKSIRPVARVCARVPRDMGALEEEEETEADPLFAESAVVEEEDEPEDEDEETFEGENFSTRRFTFSARSVKNLGLDKLCIRAF